MKLVYVECPHWLKGYWFRVDGDRAAEVSTGEVYDTETLRDNASLWREETPK